MDSKIFYQGEVQVNGSTKIVCTSTRLIILNIVINNLTSAYTFTLNRYKQKVNSEQKTSLQEVPLYKFSLEEGDSIRDTNEYILELSLRQSKGDKRRAKIKEKRRENKEIRETKNYISYESFYKTEKWIKISKLIKKFYGLKCMKCLTERGEMHADHIYPRSHYPSIEFELYNLQVLCKKCNMEKGNKECIDYRSDEEISRFNKRFVKHT
jgi:5-methylcytosine-specific restriction endonuclease McrA